MSLGPSEQFLEDMIVATPEILSDQWMIIGRQEMTGAGGRIDLLALAPDGALILIELKRAKTPREVVAQAIDYASWAEHLDAEELARIYGRFSNGGNLTEAFRQRFNAALDEDMLNASHQIVIAASSLDASSERIVGYLSKRGIAICPSVARTLQRGEPQKRQLFRFFNPTNTPISPTADNTFPE